MAMNVHERIEQLVAAQALGGSSPGQDAELDQLWAEHGASCDQCRRMEAETHEVAGRLAFALVPFRNELWAIGGFDARGDLDLDDCSSERERETVGC